MVRILENVEQDLRDALKAALRVSQRADFCAGSLNLRGRQTIDRTIQAWNPALNQIGRVLVGICSAIATLAITAKLLAQS